MLNTTWIVPSNPSDMNAGDSGAPGWWFGIQNTKGNGALIQPILAWGYLGPMYTMFNGVFGAHAAAWHRCTAASCGLRLAHSRSYMHFVTMMYCCFL